MAWLGGFRALKFSMLVLESVGRKDVQLPAVAGSGLRLRRTYL